MVVISGGSGFRCPTTALGDLERHPLRKEPLSGIAHRKPFSASATIGKPAAR
jgi:hypothetical protein